MPVKSKNQCNLVTNELLLKMQLLDIDKQIKYFLENCFDSQDSITKEAQKQIDKINQKLQLDLIKGVYKIDVYTVLFGPFIVTDNSFLGLIDLIHALECIDEENQSDVLTAKCSPAYKSLKKHCW